jgi:2-oxoglutarate ferredoxin oxidoreductase subunit delta
MATETDTEKLLQKTGASLPRGEVYLVEDRCKGCGLCIAFCPKHVLVVSDRFNKKGYHPPDLVEEEPTHVCVNCGFCERICPEFAIFVKPKKEE